MAQEISSPRSVGPNYASSRVVWAEDAISWKAIFAGVFIAMLGFYLLMYLGVAFGSAALQEVIRGEDTIAGLTWGSGVWIVVTTLVSIFLGALFASKVSGLLSMRTGRIQGAVIASLFFAIMLSQVGFALSSLTRGVGSLVGTMGGTASNVVSSPEVQDVVTQAIGDLNLKSSPEVVIQGVAVRLLRGNVEAAKNYLAMQAGISPFDAEQRLSNLQAELDQVATEIGTTAAQVAQAAGWILFGALLLGTIAAVIGGGLGVPPDQSLTRGEGKEERLPGYQKAG